MVNDESRNARPPEEPAQRRPGSARSLKEQNIHRDFGQAGANAVDRGAEAARGERRDDDERDNSALGPDAAAMTQHDLEGEGYRDRGRLAVNGGTEPLTEQAAQAPDGHAGDQGSGGTGGERSASARRVTPR